EGFNGISWLGVILSVVYFRIFDIWKPSIIGRVDKSVKGGLGVMSDDILAGFFAGIAVLITISLMIKFGASNLIF
ncbi:MAG: phosphatidylglycerophosphatase A, partial [Campylobacter sp.]|nr:phosphatidylglycerophosphatase A [Campylobacter sp.]